MSRADLDRLLADAQQNSGLREELRSLVSDRQRLTQWAETKGYHLTEDDLNELAGADHELTEEDLENVAGGDNAWGSTPPPPGTGG